MLRYIVERISDGKFLELELPISVSGAGQALCGPGRFSGSVAGGAVAVPASSAAEFIDPHATFIHEEADGVIRGTWIVTRSEADGADWKIEGAGFSSALSGHPYEGEYRGVNVDMADVVRHLWQHMQRFTGSNFGVSVRGTTGVVRGTDSDAKAEAAKKVHDAAKAALKKVEDPRKAKYKQIKTVSAPFDARLKVLNKQAKPLRVAYDAVVKQQKPARDRFTALNKERTTKRELYSALVKAKAPAAQIAAAKAAVDAMKAPIDEQRAVVKALDAPRAAAKKPVDDKNAEIRVVNAQKAVALEPLRVQYEALAGGREGSERSVRGVEEALGGREEESPRRWWGVEDSVVGYARQHV